MPRVNRNLPVLKLIASKAGSWKNVFSCWKTEHRVVKRRLKLVKGRLRVVKSTQTWLSGG